MASALAARLASSANRMRSICPAATEQIKASIAITTGIATAISAETLPRSSLLSRSIRIRKGQRALDQVEQNGPNFVASHNHHQQPRKADCSHGGDRILGGCCAFF